MPYINVTTTEKIPNAAAQSLKEKLGEAISIIPGKSEKWLMINLDGEKTLSLGGSFESCAIAQISIYGSSTGESYNHLTAQVTKILNEILNVPKDRIYVSYSECKYWGFAGSNF